MPHSRLSSLVSASSSSPPPSSPPPQGSKGLHAICLWEQRGDVNLVIEGPTYSQGGPPASPLPRHGAHFAHLPRLSRSPPPTPIASRRNGDSRDELPSYARACQSPSELSSLALTHSPFELSIRAAYFSGQFFHCLEDSSPCDTSPVEVNRRSMSMKASGDERSAGQKRVKCLKVR